MVLIMTCSERQYQGQTLVSPYVGMEQKQDGGSNGCISNYTMITQLGASVNSLTPKLILG